MHPTIGSTRRDELARFLLKYCAELESIKLAGYPNVINVQFGKIFYVYIAFR